MTNVFIGQSWQCISEQDFSCSIPVHLLPVVLAQCNVNQIENAMSMSQLLFWRMDPLGLLTCAGAQCGSAHCSPTKLQGLYPAHGAVSPKSQHGIFHISKMILWL